MRNFEFKKKIHLNMFLFGLMYGRIGLDNGLLPTRRHAFIWINYVRLLTHVCVTRLWWVNVLYFLWKWNQKMIHQKDNDFFATPQYIISFSYCNWRIIRQHFADKQTVNFMMWFVGCVYEHISFQWENRFITLNLFQHTYTKHVCWS